MSPAPPWPSTEGGSVASMIDISFATVSVVVSIPLFSLALVMAWSYGQVARKSGWVLAIIGTVLMGLGGLTGVFSENVIVWAYAGVDLSVLGFAFLLSGARLTLGIGMPLAWNWTIALANCLATLYFFIGYPEIAGLRTAAFSLSSLLMGLPLLTLDLRRPSRIRGLRFFDSSVALFSLIMAARLVFAFLDFQRDDFIDPGIDSWLFLFMCACGISAIASYILMVARERRAKDIVYVERGKPCLSLSEKGLSPTEMVYVRAILAGRAPKDISEQLGVRGSTVRSSLSRVYKKLEIDGVADLIALGHNHQIID